MNVGNLDITAAPQSATLRMRHLVEGHPGCVLAWDEVRDLIGKLQRAYDTRPAAAPDDDEDLLG